MNEKRSLPSSLARYVPPLVLSFGSVAVLFLYPPLGDYGFGAVMSTIAGYVLGTWWLLGAMRQPGDTARERRGRMILRLLIGAPTAVIFAVELGGALIFDDLWWDGVALSATAFVPVWAAVLLTLHGMRDPPPVDRSG